MTREARMGTECGGPSEVKPHVCAGCGTPWSRRRTGAKDTVEGGERCEVGCEQVTDADLKVERIPGGEFILFPKCVVAPAYACFGISNVCAMLTRCHTK